MIETKKITSYEFKTSAGQGDTKTDFTFSVKSDGEEIAKKILVNLLEEVISKLK